ncbi:hypothetical protein EUGRSUZ_C02783 [Eucalyptus grandis]|uniref:BSD2 cysteine rich domain-containing protein n=2 Tax=Eucalyptus grandis TaxID=71139 RepID=A0A059CTB2_EUCGR|nr:hypothetical protein EUGRSUZ_C02783 [Eucalyptus grandis]
MASAPWSSPPSPSFYANSRSENQLTSPVPAHGIRARDPGTTHRHPPTTTFRLVKAQAAKGDGRTKPKSMICTDCDGNGAVMCSQCKGSGVNSEDLFNGQFKAGDSCWLCGGRKHMLCGNCNGAGFIGGFMSTYDE